MIAANPATRKYGDRNTTHSARMTPLVTVGLSRTSRIAAAATAEVSAGCCAAAAATTSTIAGASTNLTSSSEAFGMTRYALTLTATAAIGLLRTSRRNSIRVDGTSRLERPSSATRSEVETSPKSGRSGRETVTSLADAGSTTAHIA